MTAAAVDTAAAGANDHRRYARSNSAPRKNSSAVSTLAPRSYAHHSASSTEWPGPHAVPERQRRVHQQVGTEEQSEDGTARDGHGSSRPARTEPGGTAESQPHRHAGVAQRPHRMQARAAGRRAEHQRGLERRPSLPPPAPRCPGQCRAEQRPVSNAPVRRCARRTRTSRRGRRLRRRRGRPTLPVACPEPAWRRIRPRGSSSARIAQSSSPTRTRPSSAATTSGSSVRPASSVRYSSAASRPSAAR